MSDIAQEVVDLHLFGTRSEVASFYRYVRRQNTRAARTLKVAAERSVQRALDDVFRKSTCPANVGLGTLLK